MRTLVFLQIIDPDGENDDLRLCEPLDIVRIPRIGESIWFREEAHHFTGYAEVVNVDHSFFSKEGVQVITIACDGHIDESVEFYLPWPDANREGAKPSPLWKSVNDDFWKSAYPVQINP